MANAFDDYMVVMVPKKAFIGVRHVIVMVVIASSQAEAIRTAQDRKDGVKPDADYKKPKAWPLSYGKPYYMS